MAVQTEKTHTHTHTHLMSTTDVAGVTKGLVNKETYTKTIVPQRGFQVIWYVYTGSVGGLRRPPHQQNPSGPHIEKQCKWLKGPRKVGTKGLVIK